MIKPKNFDCSENQRAYAVQTSVRDSRCRTVGPVLWCFRCKSDRMRITMSRSSRIDGVAE